MLHEIVKGFKLSPQQKRLCLLQQDSVVYQIQGVVCLEGKLNTEVLQLALQNIINRHDILRISFYHQPGRKVPLQVLVDNRIVSWRDIDLSSYNSREQEAKIEELLQKERQPFDFEREPLLRLCLLTLSASKHVLILGLPALCADTKTLKNLVEEICQSYAAYSKGEEFLPEGEVVQYLQFSEWQNQLLTDGDAIAGQEYWKRQKFSDLTTVALPFAQKASHELAKFEFQSIEWAITPSIFAKIEALIQKYEISTAIFLQTCWQVLLWRLAEQQEITIGIACDGRQYEELERSLGLFDKYLPLTCHFEFDSKFSELLTQVSQSVNDAYEWQDYFIRDDKTTISYFPFVFEYEEFPAKHLAADVTVSLPKYYSCIDRFNLRLRCNRYENSLILAFDYDLNCFLADDVKRLATQLQALLESVVRHPELVALKLNILSQPERQQLLVEFNQTTTTYPTDKCIHQLFEAQVTSTPDRIAVVFEEQQLTYRELNAHANKVAHYLQKLGVKPDVLVGIYCERSLATIVAMLGILKAGGAYLPIDPGLPTSSLDFRLQDAQISVLLTQQQLLDSLPPHSVQIVCLDRDWEIIARGASENPTSDVRTENLVYIIYTSGSTGVAKGVAIEHQQLLNYLYGIQERLHLPANASFATVSTFAADLGNTAIFPALCSGGCLQIISSERAANPQALADYCQRHPYDCLKIVPSHLKALLASATSKQVLPKRQLILGGEAASWQLIEQIRQLAPECQIMNHYGPTEATVGVTTFEVDTTPTCRRTETVPIGRAIANTQIYLLNSEKQPVPIGVPGELHIGGAGLARGYWHRPELTTEKFINSPFVPGERLYKTGDLARYLPDGNIEFIGRCDRQIKLHGFRIELGEIEAALLKSPALSEVAVLAWEDETGNKRLVAYVVPKHQTTLVNSALRQFLLDLLPEYMLPTIFVQLKALPLTPNGKVDRQALPTPDIADRSELKTTYVPPRTPVEKILAAIWAQVLGVEQVGIHDNFFELGGDSILSIQIVARAHQAGLQLSPKQLFECQTIAELASVININRAIVAEQGLVTGQVPLIPIQHWFFGQNLPEPHHWNQAVLLQLRQPLDPVLLQQAVQKLLEHHDALRLRFSFKGSSWQQAASADCDQVVPFIWLDLAMLSETEQTAAVAATATQLQRSLNLSTGPLVQVALFDSGATQSNRLLIVIHHLAVDGVSWRILLEDLQTAYEQLSQGQTIRLPPKTTSFKSWAERLQEYARSPAVEQEREYWTTPTETSVSRLPVDYAAGKNTKNTVASERTVSVALSVAATRALLQEVPAAYRTQINDVLLAALVQAFARWTGERISSRDAYGTLLVELEGHGREEIFEGIDLSRTVGWFATHFPVLLDISHASSPAKALKTVKEQLRAIPNRGFGYGVLRYLHGNEEIHSQLRSLPEAEVKFNYLGQFNQLLSDTSLFKLAPESSGLSRSPQGNRDRLLVVSGLIVSGQLRLDWSYSEAVHQQSTIADLAQYFLAALCEIIAHCQSPEAGGYTPSDFPQMQLSLQELDELLAEL